MIVRGPLSRGFGLLMINGEVLSILGTVIIFLGFIVYLTIAYEKSYPAAYVAVCQGIMSTHIHVVC